MSKEVSSAEEREAWYQKEASLTKENGRLVQSLANKEAEYEGALLEIEKLKGEVEKFRNTLTFSSNDLEETMEKLAKTNEELAHMSLSYNRVQNENYG